MARTEMYDSVGNMRASTPGIYDVILIDHCACFVVAARELSDGSRIYLVVIPCLIFSKLIRTDKVGTTVSDIGAIEPCFVFGIPATKLKYSICLLHILKQVLLFVP